MKFTWIGGATFLLELGAFRIVGDPVFGDGFDLDPHGTVTRNGVLPDVDLSALDAVCASSFRADHFEPGVAARLGDKTPLVSPPVIGASHGFSDSRLLVHWGSVELKKDGETLSIHATPACDGNGYFFRHTAGEKETTVYWTGDQLWSDEVRRVQRDFGYANLLIIHVGAEADARGAISPNGKEAMQTVYRMQPNAIAAIHHNTFSHYSEPLGPFVELIGRTIYEKRLRVLSEGESFSRSDLGGRRLWRVSRSIAWVVALSTPVLVLAGLALTPLFPVPDFEPLPADVDPALSYDELFPYYLEYIAMTRIHRRGGEPGGRHGHAAFYLKGVERDGGAAAYPQLRLAAEGADLSHPNTGVGVSVNKMFKNVNWVAFDGADLFFEGGMAADVVIDGNVADVIVDRVLGSGALAGVEVHEWTLADLPAGLRPERHTALKSIGTDFALRFGRDLACVRIPLTRAMMAEVVAYLNAMNAHYAENPGLDFEWNGVEDNCTHLAVNALARVSGIDPVKTDAGPLLRFFNLAIPANVFVDLATAGNDYGGHDGARDEREREVLDRHGWMLAQPGVIVRFLPRFRANNWLWQGEFDMYTMERPVVPLILVPPMQVVPVGSKWVWPPVYRFKQKAYRRLFLEARYCDLRANLEHYLSATEGAVPQPEMAGDTDGVSLYSDYLRSTRATVRAALGGH